MDLKGKKLLVTGGAGFIGSHLVDSLLIHDVEEVVIFDNFIRGNLINLEDALKDKRCRVFELCGDITSQDELNEATKNTDAVFHLASLSLPHCQKYPRSAFNVNVLGTFNLIEACVKNNIKKIIYSSSASLYGNANYSPMDEIHPLNFKDIYAATKLFGESFLKSFFYKYHLKYLNLRFMNIYGPRLDYKGAYVAVIMKIIDRIQNNLPPILHGDGSQAFDFVYVEDACNSLIMAMQSDLCNREYNISSGKQITLIELCKKIQHLMEDDKDIEFIRENRDHTLVTNRVGSTHKAKDELGFYCQTSLDKGLKKIIDWKLNN